MSLDEDDLYFILGVEIEVSEDDLKKAFRKKAMECHPDRNQNNPEAEISFKKLNEAYNILKDPEKRKSYDRKRAGGFLSSRFITPPTSRDVVNAVNEILDENLFDKIDQVLGRTFEAKNIEITLQLTLEELYNGADKTIIFKRNEKCDTCKGRGAINREDFKLCDLCYGLGHAPKLSSLLRKEKNRCAKCRGLGKIIINKCKDCKGSCNSQKEVELVIPIPKGLNIKDRLIVPEEGESGGDLFLHIETQSHNKFTITNLYDLSTQLTINFYQAILGDYLEIETLKGPAYFKIEPGSQHLDIVVLKGYGLKNGDNYGDLLITLEVKLPTFLTLEQRQLLEKFKELDKSN